MTEDKVQPSDEELITAVRNGELMAYDELMRRHEGIAFRVACGICASREGALDVVQTSFLEAYRNLGRFRGESAFRTWLLRIVLNEGKSWARSEARRSDRDRPLELPDEHRDAASGPEANAMRGEERRHLSRALQALNPRHRLAVVLRYFQGLGIPEIAAAIGCDEATARNMLFRSLRRLRPILEQGNRGAR